MISDAFWSPAYLEGWEYRAHDMNDRFRAVPPPRSPVLGLIKPILIVAIARQAWIGD